MRSSGRNLIGRIPGAYPKHCVSRIAKLLGQYVLVHTFGAYPQGLILTFKAVIRSWLIQSCHWEPHQKSTWRILGAYPKIFSREFPCVHPFTDIRENKPRPDFPSDIYVYICLASGCIVVRSFRVVVESLARDESGAYPAHIPKSSASAFLAHTLLWRFGAANADPTFPAIS